MDNLRVLQLADEHNGIVVSHQEPRQSSNRLARDATLKSAAAKQVHLGLAAGDFLRNGASASSDWKSHPNEALGVLG
ncbi:MAG: hypothetical protein GX456_11010 [Verrucomicrobia bacterium]|nr:hypothetical protein [Verrucomicrobiota bacterium]